MALSDSNGLFDDHKQVTQAVGVIGVATLASRLLGALRDIVLASVFGTGWVADAFLAAFRLPNLLRRMFGEGALSIALVPILSECLIRKGKEEASRLASTLINLFWVVLAVLSLIGFLFAPMIVYLLAPGFSQVAAKFALTVQLTRIMMPYLFFIGSVALCMGILNAFGHFMAPAVAPIFLNLCMIVSVPLSMQWGTSLVGKVQWLAASVVVGGVLQLLAQLPWLYQNRIRPFASICFWNPWISRILRPLGSVLFGTAVFQINSLVITLLATLLPQGSVSYLYYADRLVQLPLGVFAMATATAVLPTLSRQASAERLDDLRTTFAHALRFVFFMTLPAMVGLIVLRTPIVSLLFQHGAFDTLSTRLTAGVLLYYGMGLWSFAALRIVLSVFFAQKQTRAPFWSGIVSVVVNFGLGLILMDTMGPNGLALALSLASMVHFFLLVWVLRRKLGSLGWRGIAISVSKSAFCSVIMGVVVWGLSSWMTSMPGSLVSSPLVRVAVGVLVGTAIFGVTAYTLKLAELKTLGALFARG